MTKQRQILENELNVKKQRNNRLGATEPAHVQPFVPISKLVEGNRQGHGLPDYPSTRSLSRAAVLKMQQSGGNTHVQRYLSNCPSAKHRGWAAGNAGQGQYLQRQPAPGKKTAGEAVPEESKPGGKKAAFDVDKWLSGAIYDLVKTELGEDKLKEQAAKLVGKATEALMTQISGVSSTADFVQKASVEQLGKLFTADVNSAVTELLSTPAGKKVKQIILDKVKADPAFVIAMLMVALQAAVVSNAEIPELDKQLELGAGFKVEAKANLGKFRELSLKYLKLGLSYSSKYFQAGLAGTYTGEGSKVGFGGKAEVAVGTKEINFKSDASVESEGRLKLNVGPVIDLKKFGLTATASYESSKGWKGVGQARLGDKYHYWAPKLIVGADGKLSFELGHQFKLDAFSLSTTLSTGKGGTSLAHTLELKNPFGTEGLNLAASLHYRLDDPAIKAAKLSAAYEILGREKSKTSVYLLLKAEGNFQAPGTDQPKSKFQGLLILEGRY